MGIEGTEYVGDWGKKIPIDLKKTHILQTNDNARDGQAAHVTTNITGTQVKVHDRFDSSGNYLGSNFSKR